MAKRRDIDRLNELEELFADLWQVPRFAAGLRRAYRPQVDCYRTEDPAEVTVVVEIPGADPAEIQVIVEGRHVLVAGVRPRARCAGQTWYRSEIEFGPFEREIVLGDDVDVAKASASYENGLLRIVLPIAPKPARDVKVPIDVRTRP